MARGPPRDDERAQSAIVGIVLLVAVVAIGSTGILLVGLDATDRTSDRVKNEQAERAFVTLDKRMDTVARQESGSREVELGLDNDDSALRKEETGRIVVRTSDSNTEILNTSIGAIEYEQSDTTLAYQGGGVWRGTGEDARMVSSPDITYEDASLSLPLTTMTGEEELSADPISIEKSQTPSFTEYDLVEGEVVVIEITSQYYGGWAQYFREEVDNTGVTVDHENETVTVELGQFQPPEGAFDDGVSATGDIAFGGGSAEIDGNVSTTGDVDDSRVTGTSSSTDSTYAPIDRIIERRIEDAEENASITRLDEDLSGTSTLQGGKVYYAPDGIDLDGSSVTADLSGGNITLIVNGSVHMESGSLNVENPSDNTALRTYASGNFSMKNSDFCVAPCDSSNVDSEHNQVYGTSEMQVGLRGGSNNYFEGSVYAPRREEVNGTNGAWERLGGPDNKCDKPSSDDDYDVCLATGSSGFDGSIVAGSTRLSQSTEIDHDGGLDGMQPVYADSNTALPPAVTYFTITVYEVEVTDGDDDDS